MKLNRSLIHIHKNRTQHELKLDIRQSQLLIETNKLFASYHSRRDIEIEETKEKERF